MTKKPDMENHYALCTNGTIIDLLDERVFDTDIDTTVKNLAATKTIGIVKCTNDPKKLFDSIMGKSATEQVMKPFPGGSNWHKLFDVREQFEYFVAYTMVGGAKQLVAKSLDGIYWSFDIIDA
jgi:hypothetical protein